MFFMLSICIVSVFCQTLTPEYTELALGLVAKYPWIADVFGILLLFSEYLGASKWIKANNIVQFIKGLFFKKKQVFGNADLGGNKPPKV